MTLFSNLLLARWKLQNVYKFIWSSGKCCSRGTARRKAGPIHKRGKRLHNWPECTNTFQKYHRLVHQRFAIRMVSFQVLDLPSTPKTLLMKAGAEWRRQMHPKARCRRWLLDAFRSKWWRVARRSFTEDWLRSCGFFGEAFLWHVLDCLMENRQNGGSFIPKQIYAAQLNLTGLPVDKRYLQKTSRVIWVWY